MVCDGKCDGFTTHDTTSSVLLTYADLLTMTSMLVLE